jgi:hypothetical protein
MPGILFAPGLEVDQGQFPESVAVKGRVPLLDYPSSLHDIYPDTPVLTVCQAYERVRKTFERIDDLLALKLRLRHNFKLPPASQDAEALSLLSMLFDPTSFRVNGLVRRPSLAAPGRLHWIDLDEARPFPLRLASPQKLVHTLSWIDSNIKVQVEEIGEDYKLAPVHVQEIAEAALRVYALLVKQQDYFWACNMSFNVSMFLQDRILNLIFGDDIYLAVSRLAERGRLANQIALRLLENLGDLSYRQLCSLSVFMGVIWASREDVQRNFIARPGSTLSSINSQLNAHQMNWCIDHIDRFLREMGVDVPLNAVVVLDDNGESVFDMALFQRLLRDNIRLRVIFVVNLYPVSNNISHNAFSRLLKEPYFTGLRGCLSQERVAVCLERQVFRSFEQAYLQPETRRSLAESQLAYIKGANFFETFQPVSMARYHCFTVHGPTSTLLTGCCEGAGVFAKLEAGQAGYRYHSHVHVETLRQMILA